MKGKPMNTAKAGQTSKLKVGEDMVHSPSHYNAGTIEVIEFLEDQRMEFHLGNSLKYIARAGKKGTGTRQEEVTDLKKARWYINRRIELLTAEIEGRKPRRPNAMMVRLVTCPGCQKGFEVDVE